MVFGDSLVDHIKVCIYAKTTLQKYFVTIQMTEATTSGYFENQRLTKKKGRNFTNAELKAN